MGRLTKIKNIRLPNLKIPFQKITGLEKRWLKNCVSVMFALVIVCVAAIILFMSAYYHANVRANLTNKAQMICGMLQSHYGQNEDFLDTCVTYTKNFKDSQILAVEFFSADRKKLSASALSSSKYDYEIPDVAEALENNDLAAFQGKTLHGAEPFLALSVPLSGSDQTQIGVMRFLAGLTELNRQIVSFSITAFCIGLALIVCIILVSRYYLQTILKPIADITATAKRIASGSYGAQITHRFNDEIGELADTINDMSVKISQSEKTQAEFISSVSHELRTPLTAISGWGETLMAAENLDTETRRGMMIILREARRLTGMVEELLEFTRMQNGRFTLNVEQADILAEFEDTVFMYASRLKQEEILLNYTPGDETIPEIPCDVSRMRQVFLNILDNAAKHGGSGKQIDASITLENSDVVIRIRDYGPGIPEDELPHVKMKFYKGSSKARGSGIGLAVCEEIVTMHGGTLSLENAVGGGTLVTIRIPSGKE